MRRASTVSSSAKGCQTPREPKDMAATWFTMRPASRGSLNRAVASKLSNSVESQLQEPTNALHAPFPSSLAMAFQVEYMNDAFPDHIAGVCLFDGHGLGN